MSPRLPEFPCIGCGDFSGRGRLPGEYFCYLCLGAAHRVAERIERQKEMEREARAIETENEVFW